MDNLLGTDFNSGAQTCHSILVETGVYSGSKLDNMALNHSQRDFLSVDVEHESYQEPTMIVPHVLEAVKAIFRLENFF